MRILLRSIGLICIFLLLFTGVAFSADAKNGPYVFGHAGVAILSDSDLNDGVDTVTAEFDPGFALGGGGGYRFGMFRVEGEIGYQQNDFDKVSGFGITVNASGDVSCLSFLANGYIDFHNSTPFTPFISAGIGVANIDISDFRIGGFLVGSEDDTVFAYQIGAGVGYAVNKNITIDLKYRYFATEDPDFEGIKGEFASHNIYVGLRYNF